MFDDNGLTKLVREPSAYYTSFPDGSYRFDYYRNGTSMQKNGPLTDRSSIYDRAVSYDYFLEYQANKTRRYFFRNGTIAQFKASTDNNDGMGTFIRYEVPPTYYYV